MWSFQRVMQLFGFTLDKDKRQLPTDALVVLGVLFSMTMVRHSMRIAVKPKPLRLEKIMTELAIIK